MRGDYDRQSDVATNHMRVQISPDGKVSRELIGGDAEFPRIDPRLVGRQQRYISTMWQPEKAHSPFFQGIARVDLKTSKRALFDYGRDVAAEEHIYVPDPGSSDENRGWVLGTTLNLKLGRSTLNLFDAARIEEGPVAKAHLPYGWPMGLHGAFRPA